MPRPATSTPPPATDPKPAARWLIPGTLAAGILIAVSFGTADPLLARIGSLGSAWVFSGWTPLAYLIAAVGWGAIARPWTRSLADAPRIAPALDAGIGLAATLTATHALGALGLLNPITAWIWTGTGLILLARTALPATRAGRHAPALALPTDRAELAAIAAACIGVAVLLVAAASPPGALWDSEFGAYDALSYHLQLPAEWLDAGRITPLGHNIYSYLPGYMEAAVVHLAHLAGETGTGPDGLSPLTGDLAGAPHFLALGTTLIGAWITGVFATTLARRIAPDTAHADSARIAGIAAGSLVLLTPWVQVVGSIAYNEPGVIALGAAGLLGATAPGLTPARRGVLVAVLIGVGAGCKPTAVLFLAPACAIAMAMSAPVRTWPVMFALGAGVGLLTLAPWLARNAAFGANPIFPHATDLFGTAHWTADQAARYAGAHRFTGGPFGRIAMLVAPDPATSPADPGVVRWRGLTNPQWALTPWLGLIGCAIALPSARARPAGLALLAGIAGALLAWAGFTHLQSRFLIPVVPLFAAGFGLGLAVLPRVTRTPLVIATLTIAGAWSMANFARQRADQPNGLLVLGPGVFTGRLPIEGLGDEVAWAGVNETVPPAQPVLLVGDATPFYLERPVVYATTWDTHPLAEAVRQAPGDPQAWTATLRAAGLQWALISYAEIDRLSASGWADPALTTDTVGEWAASLGQPVRVWPAQGRALYRLRSPAP